MREIRIKFDKPFSFNPGTKRTRGDVSKIGHYVDEKNDVGGRKKVPTRAIGRRFVFICSGSPWLVLGIFRPNEYVAKLYQIFVMIYHYKYIYKQMIVESL